MKTHLSDKADQYHRNCLKSFTPLIREGIDERMILTQDSVDPIPQSKSANHATRPISSRPFNSQSRVHFIQLKNNPSSGLFAHVPIFPSRDNTGGPSAYEIIKEKRDRSANSNSRRPVSNKRLSRQIPKSGVHRQSHLFNKDAGLNMTYDSKLMMTRGFYGNPNVVIRQVNSNKPD
jgi:hypothetical protein